MEFLDIAYQYGKQELGEPVLADQDTAWDLKIPRSMEEAVRQGTDKAQAEDWMLASLGAVHLMEQEQLEELGPEGNNKSTFLSKIRHFVEHWAKHQIIKKVRAEIFEMIWWALKKTISATADLVIDVFQFAIRRLILPVLETILSVIATPEILIAAAIGAAAVGLGFIGKWIFEKYFSSGSEPSGSLGSGSLTGTPAAPIAAGEAAVPSATIAPPPMPTTRQGLPVKTFGRLESLIQRGESGAAGYNAYNFSTIGKVHEYAGVPLTEMTIADVQYQQQIHNYNAVGKYQLIKDTLSAAVENLHLDTSQKFDAEMQDRIFENYLLGTKKRVIGDYIAGRSDDVWAAVSAASHEWASVAAPPGYPLAKGGKGDGLVSYYSGVQGNKASISAIEMAQALQQERLSYLGQTAKSTVETGVTVPAQVPLTIPGSTQATTSASGLTCTPRTTSNILNRNGILIAING